MTAPGPVDKNTDTFTQTSASSCLLYKTLYNTALYLMLKELQWYVGEHLRFALTQHTMVFIYFDND